MELIYKVRVHCGPLLPDDHYAEKSFIFLKNAVLLQSTPNPVSITYARQYLAFATSRDPNASPGLPKWPVYTNNNPTLLQYRDDKVTPIKDDFRAYAIKLLNSAKVQSSTGR